MTRTDPDTGTRLLELELENQRLREELEAAKRQQTAAPTPTQSPDLQATLNRIGDTLDRLTKVLEAGQNRIGVLGD